MNVKPFLRRKPPQLLYHYTDQRGLLGILEKRQIWASHTQFLNDAREFHQALNVVEQVMRTLTSGAAFQENFSYIMEMREGIKGIESVNVCVCSFSEAGDLLSQWRAYGGGSGGFSLGFSGSYLRGVANAQEFWLVKCLYDEKEQKHLIKTLLEDVLRENRQNLGRVRKHTDPLGGNLVSYLNRYAPILKHKSFKEEKEWRIISRPLPSSERGFEFRQGRSMLVPYFTIPLSSDRLKFQLEEIVIGPTPHPRQSQWSLKELLAKHGLDSVRVRRSEAPYRNW